MNKKVQAKIGYSNAVLQRMIKCMFVICICSLLPSCAPANCKLYDGPELPPEKICILNDAPGVVVVRVDGKKTDSVMPGLKLNKRYRYELLPGKHEFVFDIQLPTYDKYTESKVTQYYDYFFMPDTEYTIQRNIDMKSVMIFEMKKK